MTRTERLLRLARLRGDRAAVAILEARKPLSYHDSVCGCGSKHGDGYVRVSRPTETELRALWGDR